MKVNERRTVVGGWLATVCPPPQPWKEIDAHAHRCTHCMPAADQLFSLTGQQRAAVSQLTGLAAAAVTVCDFVGRSMDRLIRTQKHVGGNASKCTKIFWRPDQLQELLAHDYIPYSRVRKRTGWKRMKTKKGMARKQGEGGKCRGERENGWGGKWGKEGNDRREFKAVPPQWTLQTRARGQQPPPIFHTKICTDDYVRHVSRFAKFG